MEDVLAVPVDFLEQYFVMMDTKFMIWFLERALDEKFSKLHAHLQTDWGIDELWCGAAREYEDTILRGHGPGSCNDFYNFTDDFGAKCEDWNGFSCERYCDDQRKNCATVDHLKAVQTQCCSTCNAAPKCLLLPFVMLHTDERTLTGSRHDKHSALESGGTVLRTEYRAEFKSWYEWANSMRFLNRFSGGTNIHGWHCSVIKNDFEFYNNEGLRALRINDLLKLAHKNILNQDSDDEDRTPYDPEIQYMYSQFQILGVDRLSEILRSFLPTNTRSHPVSISDSTCRGGKFYLDTVPVERKSPANVSVFCFSILTPGDDSVVDMIIESVKTGQISGCDNYEILDFGTTESLDGLMDVVTVRNPNEESPIIDINTLLIYALKNIFERKVHSKNDLIVNVRPGIVFSSNRLRDLFSAENLNQEKFFLNSQWSESSNDQKTQEFLSIQQSVLDPSFLVMTKMALDKFGTHHRSCFPRFSTAASNNTGAGNLISKCLKERGVDSVFHSQLLKASTPVEPMQHCVQDDVIAFVPESPTLNGFRKCWSQLKLAEFSMDPKFNCNSLPPAAVQCCRSLRRTRLNDS